MLRPCVAVLMSIVLAISQLMYRFMIWKGYHYVRMFLVLATIGHWIFLLRSQLSDVLLESDP